MAGIDEVPTKRFFCHCFSSCVAALFAQEIIKSQESENFRSEKNKVALYGFFKVVFIPLFHTKKLVCG